MSFFLSNLLLLHAHTPYHRRRVIFCLVLPRSLFAPILEPHGKKNASRERKKMKSGPFGWSLGRLARNSRTLPHIKCQQKANAKARPAHPRDVRVRPSEMLHNAKTLEIDFFFDVLRERKHLSQLFVFNISSNLLVFSNKRDVDFLNL